MYTSHGELPPDTAEEREGDGIDLEIIIEVEPILRNDVIADDFSWDKFIPTDNYLEKELERKEQEELKGMLPKRIP